MRPFWPELSGGSVNKPSRTANLPVQPSDGT
jgi:hypothetical protein